MRSQTSWSAWRFLRFSLLWLALSAMWTALLSIVLPEMADHYAAKPGQGWGRGQILALLSGVGAAVSALTQVVVGWRSDSDPGPWRRWKFMLIGLPLTALPLYLLGRSSSLPEVLLALVLLQLTANAATGPYQALIPDAVPPEKHGAASTWMGLFQHAGQILGPVLAMFLLGERLVGLPRLEAVVYFGLIIGLVGLWSALPPAGEAPGRQRVGLRQAIVSVLSGERNFQLLIQSRLIINIGFYLVVNFLLFYVRYSLGFEADRQEVTTRLLGCMVIGGLVGGLVIGPLADRRSKKPLLFASCGLTGLGMLGFVCAPAHTVLVPSLFAALAGFGFGGFSVVDWSLACNLAPRASSALSMGVWNLAAVLPQIIAPGLFGPLSDALVSGLGPSPSYRIVMGAVILFLGLGCARLIPLQEKPS